MDFKGLKKVNTKRDKECYAHCEDWGVTDWGCAIAGETGELCNLLKKVKRGDEVDPIAIQEEIADIVIYCDLLASYLRFDLEKAIIHKFNKTSDKLGSKVKLSDS